MTTQFILALDQGTSSSRCFLYDKNAKPIATAQQEFRQYYPAAGWVEHNAEEIWQSQLDVIKKVLNDTKIKSSDIAGIGITNQRETSVIWDRQSGKPIYHAIVWQDRRTTNECQRLKQTGIEPSIQNKTGLLIDPYFSATKIKWLLDNIDGARAKAERGELAFGTIDSWLIWNLTQGKLHITDASNASRTLLYNIEELCWDQELLTLFNIPDSLLPEVKNSSEIYGLTQHPELGSNIPIAANVGDQQAALFGQLCHEPGMAKCTYGTGSFLMMNIGKRKNTPNNHMLTTIAWKIADETYYAIEGSVFIGGAVVQWLRDGVNLIEQASDSENLAYTANDNGGVYFVPAFTGLGAPYWDPNARGAIFGITRGTTKAHITRAALESIAFQVDDLIQTITLYNNKKLSELRIDGGAAKNNLMLQFQADISKINVIRPANLETTALGAAYLAGLAVGYWKINDLKQSWQTDQTFIPNLPTETIDDLKHYWRKAVDKSKDWLA